MGGYGSGRWGDHKARITAEVSLRLSIGFFRAAIRQIEKRPGTITSNPQWTYNKQPAGNIQVEIRSAQSGEIQARLKYRASRNSISTDYDYRVGLTHTLLLHKYKQWYWKCPDCGRRAGTLYLPPNQERFLCRSCHNLTYTSCLESHQMNRLNRLLGPKWLETFSKDYPGLTGEEIGRVMDCEMLGKRLPRVLAEKMDIVHQYKLDKFIRQHLQSIPKPYAGYLTIDELCQQAGLSMDNLSTLADARLLLPDRPSDKYRPKLVGWAKKLAYLLNEGWTVDEIHRWARGRWQTANPRQWPPKRDEWQAGFNHDMG